VTDLERALLELDVEWPETPDLAAAVRARIVTAASGEVAGGEAPARVGGGEAPTADVVGGDAVAGRRRPRTRLRRRLAWPAAALAVALGGVAVVPAARSAVLEWLGLKSVEIHQGPVPKGTPPPVNPAGLGLGEKVTLAQARARTPVLVPRSLGAPSAVYLGTLEGGPQAVSLVYGKTLLVQTFRARATPYIRKTVGSAKAVRPLRIDGARAYWITGAHGFVYAVGANNGGYEPQRIAGSTLLVEQDGLLLRIEGALGEDRAVQIARDALS
jgi:hypothetical protein